MKKIMPGLFIEIMAVTILQIFLFVLVSVILR